MRLPSSLRRAAEIGLSQLFLEQRDYLSDGGFN
jgi:hypothetical protein